MQLVLPAAVEMVLAGQRWQVERLLPAAAEANCPAGHTVEQAEAPPLDVEAAPQGVQAVAPARL